MKIKQVVSTKFYSAYTGWNSLQFTDEAGNEIDIQMSDQNYLDLAKTVGHKAERIRNERAEEAARLAEENADE
tara:strand:+ start:2668 stop:2886 length:219 start_codon:yes stop_codon:yes gene_type:complete